MSTHAAAESGIRKPHRDRGKLEKAASETKDRTMNRIHWRFPDVLLFVSTVVSMFAAQAFCDKFFGSPANAGQMLRYVLIVTMPGFACA